MALISGSIGWRLKIARINVTKQNGDSEAKKLLAAAVVLQLQRSRKYSEKWDIKANIVEGMDLLKRRVLLETITVVARRYIK